VKVKKWHIKFADFCYSTLLREQTGMTANGLIRSYVDSRGTRYVPNITVAAWILRRDGRFRYTGTKSAVYSAIKR
jgi:hypothetical protein